MSVEQMIFTDRPKGKGLDPGASGYQIAACSSGVDPDIRSLLSSICIHYGQAVYGNEVIPRTAKEKETKWRKQITILDSVPEEILKEFPEIWSYDRLRENLFALTRVNYVGLSHDGRFGNFFAHSLIFAPAVLSAYRDNPLSLTRSNLFLSSDTVDGTELPVLSDLGSAVTGRINGQILRHSPYRDHLPDLVSALTAATPSTRPLIVCLANWREALSFVEELVNLLPRYARCRVTVCTYESDRKWLPSTKGGRPPGLIAAHSVLVLCGKDGNSFDLRLDEYQSTFAIFNFVDNQFSELGEPRKFAQFAADCVVDGKMKQLQQHHKIVEQLGYEQNYDVWDALVPAAVLLEDKPTPKILAEGIHVVIAQVTQPSQIETVLGWILPHIRLLAQQDDAAGLKLLDADLSILVNKQLSETESGFAQGFISEVQGMASNALAEGHGRKAEALLAICGSARERILLELSKDALAKPDVALFAPTNPEDQKPLINLLLDTLRLAEKISEETFPFAQLLIATFRMARDTNLVAYIWECLGDTLVKPRLSGQWDAEKQKLVADIIKYVPADKCPDGYVWLNIEFLKVTKPQGENLLARLVDLTRISSRCTRSTEFTSELLLEVERQFFDTEERAVALGRMTESAQNTASEEGLFKAYRDAMKKVIANRHNSIRLKLADAGVVQVLCRELLEEILPWSEEDSRRKFQDWQGNVLSRPQIMENLCQQVTNLLKDSVQIKGVLPLAECLIPKQQGGAPVSKGLIALYNAVVFALPLQPLSDKWNQLLASPLAGLLPKAEGRLRVLRFLRHIEGKAKTPNWSTTEFPCNDDRCRDISSLNEDEKKIVLKWCIGTFVNSGVTTPQEAQGLVRLLKDVGEKSVEAVALAVEQLLDNRDPVTYVLAATAFTTCGLKDPNNLENWASIVGTIIKRFDRKTVRLFEEHLEKRFYQQDKNYDKCMQRISEYAGFSYRQSAAQTIQTLKNNVEVAQDTGIMDKATNFLRKFMGKSKKFQPSVSNKNKQ